MHEFTYLQLISYKQSIKGHFTLKKFYIGFLEAKLHLFPFCLNLHHNINGGSNFNLEKNNLGPSVSVAPQILYCPDQGARPKEIVQVDGQGGGIPGWTGAGWTGFLKYLSFFINVQQRYQCICSFFIQFFFLLVISTGCCCSKTSFLCRHLIYIEEQIFFCCTHTSLFLVKMSGQLKKSLYIFFFVGMYVIYVCK